MFSRISIPSLALILLLAGSFFFPEPYDLRIPAEASAAPLPSAGSNGPMLRRIATSGGIFWIGYENGSARLSGTPAATGGCGDWKVDAFGGGKIVEFHIVHEMDAEEVCIQKLGEQAPVGNEVSAEPDALYLILLDKEVIYAGRLSVDPTSPLI
jgi:hypothetical protein